MGQGLNFTSKFHLKILPREKFRYLKNLQLTCSVWIVCTTGGLFLYRKGLRIACSYSCGKNKVWTRPIGSPCWTFPSEQWPQGCRNGVVRSPTMEINFDDPRKGSKLQPKWGTIYDSQTLNFTDLFQLVLIYFLAVFEFPWGHSCRRSSILILSDLFSRF